jgi:hypothetical protein
MTTFSKLSKITLSAETEEQVNDILSRVAKLKSKLNEFLSKSQAPISVDEPSKLVESLIGKFHTVAVEINCRYDSRASLAINDEYDVQDLLRGLLKIYFDDIRDEEWTPSYGGSCARIDILLQNEEIAIETKMMRKSLTRKKVRDELIIDKVHYQKHPRCKKLYCVIYDPQAKLKNPDGFEADLTDVVNGFVTKVYVIPRRG